MLHYLFLHWSIVMLLLGRGLRNRYGELEIREQLMRASGLLEGVFRDCVSING